MIIKTEGIVLKQMKYGESSLILDVFTKEKGLRSCIVSGVRSKNSKAAMYQIMNCLDMVIYDKDADKLNRIKESSLNLIYQSLPLNMFKSSIGIFLMDICRNAIKEREPNEELYRFLKSWLEYLDQTSESLAYLPCLFMLELSEHLGFQPQDNFSVESPLFNLMDGSYTSAMSQSPYTINQELSSHLIQLQHSKKSNGFSHLEMSKKERHELLLQLIKFYKLHIDGFKDPKSLEVLSAVLS